MGVQAKSNFSVRGPSVQGFVGESTASVFPQRDDGEVGTGRYRESVRPRDPPGSLIWLLQNDNQFSEDVK